MTQKKVKLKKKK